MSANRKRCFDSIVQTSKVTVKLITDNNLSNFLVEPLHEGFQYLSSTHKSDYLRSYFMNFYGGGYTDIKLCEYDWNIYFDILDNSNRQFIGCPQYSPKHIAYRPYKIYFEHLIGNGHFIFKKNTDFAKLWYDTTNHVMDIKLKELKKYPGTYHPRAILGGVQGEPGLFSESKYPLQWNELMGRIFHKLQYENLGTFLKDMPFPVMKDYR